MFSQRSHQPIKVATAFTLAIVSALWLGWERPYWAAFTVVVMAATETTGHSLHKGRHRILGTLCGICVAFVLAGLFAQQLPLLLLSYTLVAAVCIYHQTHPKNGYIWSMTFMIASVILVMGQFSGAQTFSLAVLRLQETILGVCCFTFVYSLLWPTSGKQVLIQTLQNEYDAQAEHLETLLTTLTEQGSLDHTLSVGDSLKRLTRLDDLVLAAQADSHHIASTQHIWQRYLAEMKQWALLCGHLSEIITLLPTTLPAADQATIEPLLRRLQQRAVQATALLKLGQLPHNPMSAPIDFTAESATMAHHHGARKMLAEVLSQLDQQSHTLLNTLSAALIGQPDTTPTSNAQTTTARAAGWQLNSENLLNAIKGSLVIWICIGLWFYFPMPGGAMIILLGAILCSVLLTLPFICMRMVLSRILIWSAIMLLQYIFILPMMSEIWQLAGFYFLNTFAIWYRFAQPQHIIQRLLGTQLLAMMTSGAMQLTPQYDIQLALVQLLLVGIAMLVIYGVINTVFSGVPERVFLREMKQLRLGLKQRLRVLSQASDNPLTRKRVFRQSPLRSTAMAEIAAGAISPKAFPNLDAEAVKALISDSYTVCLRYAAFEERYHDWLSTDHHPGIAQQILLSLNELTQTLDTPLLDNRHTAAERKLQMIADQLQQFLTGLDQHSAFQVSLSPEQADRCYQLIIALLLLAQSLRQIRQQASPCQLEQLQYARFTL